MTDKSDFVPHSVGTKNSKEQSTTNITDAASKAIIKNIAEEDEQQLKAYLAGLNHEEFMVEFNKENNKPDWNMNTIFFMYNEASKRGISYFTLLTDRLKNLGK